MDSCARFLTALWDSREVGGPRIVLSAHHEAEDDTNRRVQLATELGGTIVFPLGENTFEEAQHAVAGLQGSELTIVTSTYHLPRAYLTFLRALQRADLDQRVWLWGRGSPSDLSRLPVELQKIAIYQKRHHVASYAEGAAHLLRRAAA